ncbi:hypothetical protein HK102_009333, partial [Quaeritorhiza haematococci]
MKKKKDPHVLALTLYTNHFIPPPTTHTNTTERDAKIRDHVEEIRSSFNSFRERFLSNLRGLRPESVSLGVLVTDRLLYINLRRAVLRLVRKEGYHSGIVIYSDPKRLHKHSAALLQLSPLWKVPQKLPMDPQTLARLRNTLVTSTLSAEHDYVLWVDPSVIRIDGLEGVQRGTGVEVGSRWRYVFEKMRRSGSTRMGIVGGLCTRKEGVELFPVQRKKGDLEGKEEEEEGFKRVDRLECAVDDANHPAAANQHPSDLGFLVVRADVHREGVLFPTWKVVGTNWTSLGGKEG